MGIKDDLSMYSKSILLVDDVPLFIEMAREFFRREQVNILTAHSGPEAVEVVARTRPDIVFMDLYMSGGDGDEACKRIKGDHALKSVPVIIMTSSTLPHDIERCRNAGCDDFIKKPMTREVVLDVCNRFIRVPAWSGKRVKARIPVKFWVSHDRPLVGHTYDLSVGGIFLETDERLPVGAEIELEFLLSQSMKPIRCRGRIVWVNTMLNQKKSDLSKGVGIEFFEINKLDILAIRTWVSQRS